MRIAFLCLKNCDFEVKKLLAVDNYLRYCIITKNVGENVFNMDFIISSSNQLAASCCYEMATRAKKKGNILFVQGASSCGKSQLLSATAELFQETFPNEKTSKMAFRVIIDDYTKFYKKNDTDSFFKKYCDYKLLLIDDVQCSVGMTATQEIFANIFKKLTSFGADIVLFSEINLERYEIFYNDLINEPNFCVTEIKEADLILRKRYLDAVLAEMDICLTNTVLRYILFNREIELSSFKGCVSKIKLAKSLAKDELDDEAVIDAIKEYA